MIRMVLFALGFVAITIGLVVFQPGSKRAGSVAPLPEPVTRADPLLEERSAASTPEISQISNGIVLEPRRPTTPAPQAIAGLPPADMDDQSLRKMTWQTLSNLNHATGQEKAPGEPGSLLHTIVRRSLNDNTGQVAPNGLAPAAPDAPQVYVVQPGDSLVSIAEKLYGDVNMTGPLFAANQTLLTRPDDLQPGQTLLLPAN